MGKCKVALITLAGRPRADGMATGTVPRSRGGTPTPDEPFEFPYGPTVVNMYAMCATRHMYEFGTTSEQLAWVKVAASRHAQHDAHALLRDLITPSKTSSNSPLVADPLHRLDCCVVTPTAAARSSSRGPRYGQPQTPPGEVRAGLVGVRGTTTRGGKVDLTSSPGTIWAAVGLRGTRAASHRI